MKGEPRLSTGPAVSEASGLEAADAAAAALAARWCRFNASTDEALFRCYGTGGGRSWLRSAAHPRVYGV